MALKLAANPTFKHKVRASVPIDGGFRDETFEATFNVLSPDKMEEFDLTTGSGTTEFLKAAIVSLGDLAGEDGLTLPYSDEVRDQVLALPYARTALIVAYGKGVAGAKSGN